MQPAPISCKTSCGTGEGKIKSTLKRLQSVFLLVFLRGARGKVSFNAAASGDAALVFHCNCTLHTRSHSEAETSVIQDLTSSLADMVEAGVLGTELREVLGAVPDELCESPSPATS